jgi:hypothetical protein
MLAALVDGTTTTTIDPSVAIAQEQSGTVTLVLLMVLAVTTLVVLRRVRRIRREGTARPR